MSAAALPPVDWARVGAVVRQARNTEQESLRDFGARIGVDYRVLHNLERNKPIKTENYLQLCVGLNRDPYELAGIGVAA